MKKMIEFLLEHSPALAVGLPLLFAFFTPLVNFFGKRVRNAFVLIGVILTTGIVLLLGSSVLTTGARVYSMGAGSPSLTLPSGLSVPVRIILQIDALSVLMSLLAVSIAFFSVVYSYKFVKGKDLEKFYSLFLVMLTGLIGLVCTGDLFSLFVFFEVLSISSTALIAYWFHKRKAVEASFKYLVVSALASLFLLFSIGLLYGQHGALNLAALAGLIEFSFIEMTALGLLIAAFAMKAGAAPMHYWLPDAYGEAPTPITTMLGIASLSSLYVLMRIAFTLFGSFSLFFVSAWILIVLGLLSMFLGVTLALKQNDLKRLIAFSAVSQTGFILTALGVGLGSGTLFSGFGFNALKGGLFHLLNHGLYEALLFLSAGAVIFATGKRELNELSGLARKMPFTAVFFLIGALAIAGIPPMNGFASKLLIYESVYLFNPLITVLALMVSVLTLIPFVKAFSAVFLGPELKELKKTREAPKTMLFCMLVLALIVVFIGLFPGIIVENLIEPAARALASQTTYIGGIL